MCCVAILVCLLAVCSVQGEAVIKSARLRLRADDSIVGGKTINIKEAPYQVSLQLQGAHDCGGSIIKEQHVLTAGHCVRDGPKGLSVGFGASRLFSLKKVPVTRAVPHPKFSFPGVDWDVGVVKIAKSFPMSAKVRPIVIVGAGQEAPDNEQVMVSGWGSRKPGGQGSSRLMAVNIVIINRALCKKQYQDAQEITHRMTCAGVPKGGKDPCYGDSGGPLVILSSKKQVGIVSWGVGCAGKNRPAVFTNIADHSIQTFIQKHMKN